MYPAATPMARLQDVTHALPQLKAFVLLVNILEYLISLTLYAAFLDVSWAPHIRSGILVNSHALILQKEFFCTAGRIGLDLRDGKAMISKGGAIATGPAFLNALRCCVLIKRQMATI
ncbi:unnamed protein product [Macrosiphum euphorbiae]|uniref:Uncharacterized protein n=1 Tax=Macrosiphum euphorbiae TaxID=13131 RepID=A0AAV0XZR6_9HEMI|nr:unnamed protein product [Macrosiphum euphorbiae]